MFRIASIECPKTKACINNKCWYRLSKEFGLHDQLIGKNPKEVETILSKAGIHYEDMIIPSLKIGHQHGITMEIICIDCKLGEGLKQ